MIAFLKEKILTLGTAACPPYHLAIVHRRHLGRADDEDGEARLHQVSRQPADARAARTATPSATRDGAGGAEAHAVARRRRAVRRQVFLPRRARDPAAAPRRVAADRLGRVVLGRPPGDGQDHHATASILEELESNPAQYMPEVDDRQARRRGGEDRPQQADEGNPGAAHQVSDQDAAVAVRPDDRGARHGARQTARAAGAGAGAARLFQEPSGVLRGSGEDAGGLRLRRVRPDHGGADGFVSSRISRRPAARW